MLQFLNPIWLAAGSAVLVPVIIHLWNIRKGRVLRVGSTLLMAAATQKSATRQRISEWLLLLLRCFLIIVLSFILAGAFWQTNKTENSKGWVLIDPDNFNTIYNSYKINIDSLLGAGFELHAFNGAFDLIQLSDSSDRDTSLSKETYWSLLRQLDYKLPARFPVYLFTGNQLSQLAMATTNVDRQKAGRTIDKVHAQPATPADNLGRQAAMARPVVSIDLHWFVVPGGGKDADVQVAARQLANGKFQSLVMQSSDDGTYFRKNIPPDSTNADTSTKRVRIVFDEKYRQDARYLEAALKAIAAFGGYKMDVSVLGREPVQTAGLNWLFWLSDKKLSSADAEHSFIYMPGTGKAVRSWLREDDGAIRGSVVKLYRLIEDSLSENHTATWRDGYGNPVLSRDNRVYKFYTRFNPNWSDLPWSPQFPKKLLQLIMQEPAAADGRTFTTEDALPTIAKQTIKNEATAYQRLELKNYLWLLAFVLFAAERFLSTNKFKPGTI